jgi:UDP-glucose 4-epimerase
MNVILLGHTGFIGRNIYKHLVSAGVNNLIGISTGEIDLTAENSHEALMKELSPDCIVILCSGVKKQLGDNLNSFEKNITIVNNFIRAISNVHPRKVIFFSSASVYGEDVSYHAEISEETPAQPRTYYGIAKYTAECLLEKSCADTQTQLMILRPPLTYGKDDLSRGYGPTGFTYQAINNEEVILWGDGRERREFVYVDDVGRTVNRMINNDYSGILNLVSGKSYTYKDILDCLKEITGLSINIDSRDRTKEKVDHHYSNKLFNHVVEDFKFTSLKDGLKDMYQSIVSNKNGKK